MHTKFQSINLKGKKSHERTVVDGRTVLKWFHKLVVGWIHLAQN
jgi:hypothetical protein